MDIRDRIAKLTPARRRAFERSLREHGLAKHEARPLAGIETSLDEKAACSISLMFFASKPDSTAPYDLLTECARFADGVDFEAIWLPERHFVEFGGHFPNPAVLSAALAMITKRIGLRAGSVIVPLDDPIRIVEQWSVVDNLSNGRVAVSCAAGWHPNDFCLAPENFSERKRLLIEGIGAIRALWRGREALRLNGVGDPTHVRIRPSPVQADLPLWVTALGEETFELAGALGTNVLTGPIGMDIDELARRIGIFRRARQQSRYEGRGRVTLMQHTLVGDDAHSVRQTSLPFLKEYLGSFLDQGAAEIMKDAVIGPILQATTADDRDACLTSIANAFIHDRALIGDADTCRTHLAHLASAGVDEVACLIDFGLPPDSVLDSLKHLAALAR
jgi:natural product biosynthesis luciferase-like monooxygenase protein